MSRRARIQCIPLWMGLTMVGPAAAVAAEPGGDEEPRDADDTAPADADDAEASSDTPPPRGLFAGDSELSKREHTRWLNRWAPERNMLEVGVFGGLLVPARDLELFEPRLDRPRQGFLPLARISPEVGVRVGYFPLRFLGIEAEGAFAPTQTLEDGYTTHLFAGRGHLIAQLPFSSVTPFVAVGGGFLGIQSDPEVVLGRDIDPALHLGIGTKVYINRRISVRLDLRDVITPRRGSRSGATNSIEALLGVSFTLGRTRDVDKEPEPELPPPEPSDRDDDGFLDDEDACPDTLGIAPDGCPPPGDRDADGFIDEQDACPDKAGIEPDGCPDLDADGDGIPIPTDQCPDVPETINNFEDTDGCADEVPEDLQQFNGRLEGINFELGKATLTDDSRPVLDNAVEVLRKYAEIRIEISGHTDNSGARELNMRLSERRSEAVKQYLVDHGIDEARIQTRGAGPDEPFDSNATKEGRANNRRIEFRVLK